MSRANWYDNENSLKTNSQLKHSLLIYLSTVDSYGVTCCFELKLKEIRAYSILVVQCITIKMWKLIGFFKEHCLCDHKAEAFTYILIVLLYMQTVSA